MIDVFLAFKSEVLLDVGYRHSFLGCFIYSSKVGRAFFAGAARF